MGPLVPARKLRVEIFDSEGNRYTVSCEGHVSRQKILHVLDLAELLGGTNVNDGEWEHTSYDCTKFDLFRSLLGRIFPNDWFSSKEAQLACERELNLSFGLSTVSTYLARLVDRGFLMRKGSSSDRKYRSLSTSYNDQARVLKDDK
ncbi:MAG TPA: hypothetical protein VK487_03970 [Candidatus Bathyarchaeia archaeon]|nr:hypothetical protein [Candidatus Bathyarchaeia archaeon]